MIKRIWIKRNARGKGGHDARPILRLGEGARAPVRSDKSLNKAMAIYYNVFQPFRPAFFIRTED